MEILGALFFIVTIILTFITASAARKRGRSGFGWFLLACVISPYIALIILACLGDTEEKKKDKIYEEELLRKEIKRSNFSEAEESTAPSQKISQRSGKTINDLYKR